MKVTFVIFSLFDIKLSSVTLNNPLKCAGHEYNHIILKFCLKIGFGLLPFTYILSLALLTSCKRDLNFYLSSGKDMLCMQNDLGYIPSISSKTDSESRCWERDLDKLLSASIKHSG